MTDNIETPEQETPQEVSEQPRRGGRQRKERSPLDEILALVAAEVAAQDEKWGEQNHHANGGEAPDKGRAYAQEQADRWKTVNDGRVAAGTIGWDGIAYEEVFEAFAEEDPELRKAEMIQAAAVFVNAILSLDRTGL